MKCISPFALSVFLLLGGGFSGAASAQGCGQLSVDEGDIKCCNGTETQENRSCGPGGYSSDFCSEGYGECCGTEYSTTNVTYDPQECGGGCCPISNCGSSAICNSYCNCQNSSPIIIDTTGHGFHLTSARDGVEFDILGEGRKFKIAWTAADSGKCILDSRPQW